MKSKISLPIAFMLASFLHLSMPASAADDAEVKAVMAHTVDDVIVPGYAQFQTRATAMKGAMERLCVENSKAALQNARHTFDGLVEDWSRIEVLRDGPVILNNRMERILFYPDRKGLALRQIQALLAEKHESAITPDIMPQKSVAVQGMTALEFVLFGTGAEELEAGADNYRCHAGAAITNNIANVAANLSALWQDEDGVQADWKTPSADNGLYRTGDEAMTGLLGVLVHGVEHIRDSRILKFYDKDEGLSKPKIAIYRRSDNTFASIAANLEGLQAFWLMSGMQGVIKGDASAVTTNITFDFKTAIKTARDLDMPVADILKNDKLRAKLDFLNMILKDLQDRLNNDYGAAMGMSAGFSFSDGD